MDFQKEAEDPFNTQDERSILLQLDSLERQSHAGALFEDLKRHPAWRKVEEFMNTFMEESNKKLFNDPDGDHRKVIFQVQGMARLRNWINAQSLAGQIASRAMQEHYKSVEDEKKALGM